MELLTAMMHLMRTQQCVQVRLFFLELNFEKLRERIINEWPTLTLTRSQPINLVQNINREFGGLSGYLRFREGLASTNPNRLVLCGGLAFTATLFMDFVASRRTWQIGPLYVCSRFVKTPILRTCIRILPVFSFVVFSV